MKKKLILNILLRFLIKINLMLEYFINLFTEDNREILEFLIDFLVKI